jgi:hypothetical protein
VKTGILDKIFGKKSKELSGKRSHPSRGSRSEIKIVDLRSDKEQEIERQAQSGQSEEDEQIALKLLSLIQQAVSESYTDKEASKKTIAEINKIGKYLCSNGGKDRMVRIAYRVQALGGSARHLEVYWGHEHICGWLP